MGSFSIFSWIIVAAIFFLLYLAIKGLFGGNGKVTELGAMICQNCGSRGQPKKIIKGSIFIELILWLCLIIPGLIYSIWRLTTRQDGCPSCGQPGMINVTTPHGRLLVEKLRVAYPPMHEV